MPQERQEPGLLLWLDFGGRQGVQLGQYEFQMLLRFVFGGALAHGFLPVRCRL